MAKARGFQSFGNYGKWIRVNINEKNKDYNVKKIEKHYINNGWQTKDPSHTFG